MAIFFYVTSYMTNLRIAHVAHLNKLKHLKQLVCDCWPSFMSKVGEGHLWVVFGLYSLFCCIGVSSKFLVIWQYVCIVSLIVKFISLHHWIGVYVCFILVCYVLCCICGMNYFKMPTWIFNNFRHLNCSPPCWLLISSTKSTINQHIVDLKKSVINMWVSFPYCNHEKQHYEGRWMLSGI